MVEQHKDNKTERIHIRVTKQQKDCLIALKKQYNYKTMTDLIIDSIKVFENKNQYTAKK